MTEDLKIAHHPMVEVTYAISDLLHECKNREVRYAMVLFLLYYSKTKQPSWFSDVQEAVKDLGTAVAEKLLPLFDKLWRSGGEDAVLMYINDSLDKVCNKSKAVDSVKIAVKKFIALDPKLHL